MINVSTSFDERMSMNTRPGGIAAEVEFRQIADGAAEAATYSATGQSAVSQLVELSSGEHQLPDYARLEYGGWPLDGTKQIQPDTMTGQVGAWSDAVTDDSCNFPTPMVVTVSLSKVITTVGLSFYFDTAQGGYPPAFKIEAYNGSTLIETFTAAAAGPICALEHPIDNYNKLVITFSSWNAPYTRARLVQVIFGIVRIFDNKEMVEFSVLRAVDPVNSSPQAGDLKFAFDNRDGKWDFENPSGIYKYLMNRMQALPRVGFAGELVSLGVYYLSDWSADQSVGKMSMEAQDALSLLDDAFKGGPKFTSQTLTTIAQAAFAQAGITNYSLNSSLSAITVTATVSNLTCRQALAHIAMAACLTLYVDVSGTVVIGQLPTVASSYTISYLNSQKPVGSMDQPLKSVIVKYGETTDEFGTRDLTASATYADSGQEISITDNPFITTLDRATAVRDWLASYYQRRKDYQNTWRQNPKLEPGDIVGVQTDFGTPAAQILSQQYTFSSGGLNGQTKSKGV